MRGLIGAVIGAITGSLGLAASGHLPAAAAFGARFPAAVPAAAGALLLIALPAVNSAGVPLPGLALAALAGLLAATSARKALPPAPVNGAPVMLGAAAVGAVLGAGASAGLALTGQPTLPLLPAAVAMGMALPQPATILAALGGLAGIVLQGGNVAAATVAAPMLAGAGLAHFALVRARPPLRAPLLAVAVLIPATFVPGLRTFALGAAAAALVVPWLVQHARRAAAAPVTGGVALLGLVAMVDGLTPADLRPALAGAAIVTLTGLAWVLATLVRQPGPHPWAPAVLGAAAMGALALSPLLPAIPQARILDPAAWVLPTAPLILLGAGALEVAIGFALPLALGLLLGLPLALGLLAGGLARGLVDGIRARTGPPWLEGSRVAAFQAGLLAGSLVGLLLALL